MKLIVDANKKSLCELENVDQLHFEWLDGHRTIRVFNDLVIAEITHWPRGTSEWSVHLIDDEMDVVINHENWCDENSIQTVSNKFVATIRKLLQTRGKA